MYVFEASLTCDLSIQKPLKVEINREKKSLKHRFADILFTCWYVRVSGVYVAVKKSG